MGIAIANRFNMFSSSGSASKPWSERRFEHATVLPLCDRRQRSREVNKRQLSGAALVHRAARLRRSLSAEDHLRTRKARTEVGVGRPKGRASLAPPAKATMNRDDRKGEPC